MSNRNKKNSQVIMKQDTSDNWKKSEDKYIPVINTILIYQDEGAQPRIKIADGIHVLGELPFINNTNTVQESPKPLVDGDLLEFKY